MRVHLRDMAAKRRLNENVNELQLNDKQALIEHQANDQTNVN